MEEPREKCEAFKNYYFVCFRSFDQDQYSVTYLQPLGMYIIILKEGILTVSWSENHMRVCVNDNLSISKSVPFSTHAAPTQRP